MANKQYKSIIRLFHHCDIATDGEINLSRVKKQLQAEFSIAQEGFIEIEGYTYNRHDVFEEIERPDFQKRLAFHKMIWERPQVLQLLENSIIDFTTISLEFKDFWNNPDFDAFFSPYFAGPFNYIARTLLAENKVLDAGELMAYEGFLQPEEREEAFRPVRIFLEENMRLLRNVTGENYKLMRPKIGHWIDGDWYLLFNHLPNEFYEIKNDITTAIINIGVSVQKSQKKDCRKMSEQLISLKDTPESLRDIIVSNHAIYTRGSESTNWRGGGWTVFVIWILVKVFAVDSCKDNSYKYSPPVKYVFPDSLLKKYSNKSNEGLKLDSVYKLTVPPVKAPSIKY